MSRLFISHSSDNNAEAIALRDWLVSEGWDEFFLDIDPSSGIVSGERWQSALNEAADRCEAVLFLISHAWASSTWCQTEMHLAARLNKRIFGLLVQDVPLDSLPESITAEWQLVSLHGGNDHRMFDVVMPFTDERRHVTFSRSGLTRLKVGLVKAGLDPRTFPWPPARDPERLPYRGLRPLEAEDAGIFFGRDAQILAGLERLGEMAKGPAPRCLVILGASGAGKSSFLRAGLLPRLIRDDRRYVTLPIVRAGRAALTGETGLVQCLETALAAQGAPHRRAALRTAAQAGAAGVRPLLETILSIAAPGAEGTERPLLVLPIDQGEELFTAEAREEADAFLAILADLLAMEDIRLLALFTIRSDSYELLQTAPALDGVAQEIFSLPPIPLGAFGQVIEGPARRMTEAGRPLRIEPALTAALLAEMQESGGRDLLPLLSFTLEKLFIDYGGEGDLTLDEYREFGGMSGAVAAAVALAFERAAGDPRVPRDEAGRHALLRRALVPWLAGIDPHSGTPRRRVARLAEIPADARPLVEHLVEARILATDRNPQTGETTVEPAHEALLRQWKPLRAWLDEDAASLNILETVRNAAREWQARGRDAGWLLHAGTRLGDAEALLARDDLSAILEPADRAYLAAARAAENRRRDEEAAEATRLAAARRAVMQRTVAGLVAALVLAVLAGGFGWYGLVKSREATAFAAQAQDRAREARANAERADRSADMARLSEAQATASAEEARRRADEALVNETISLAALSRAAKLEGLPEEAVKLALAAWPRAGDENRPARAQTIESLARALPDLRERLRYAGQASPIDSVAYAPDGASVLSASFASMSARVVSVRDGSEGLVIPGFLGDVLGAAYSPDGARIVTGSMQGNLFMRDAATGAQTAVLVGHTEWINAVAFSPDGTRVLSASNDDTARIWDAATGATLAVLAGPAGDVQNAAFSADGSTVATVSSDGAAALWRADGTKLRDWPGNGFILTSTGFSRDGSVLFVGGYSGAVEAYGTGDGRLIASFEAGSPVRSLALSPDGAFLAAGSNDGSIRIWRLKGAELLLTLRGHEDRVNSLAFSPDGRELASGSSDGTMRIWTIQPAPPPIVMREPTGSALVASAFSPDGRRIATASAAGAVRIWSAADGRALAELPARPADDPAAALAFSPDGQTLAVGGASGTVSVLNGGSGAEVSRAAGLGKAVRALAFSPDGRTLAIGGDSTDVVLAQATDGAEIRRLTVGFGGDEAVSALGFSPDGARLGAVAGDSAVRLFETASGREITAVDRSGSVATAAAISPALDLAAAYSADIRTTVFGTADDGTLATLRGESGFVLALAFSPDGTRLASGGGGTAPAVWDASTGTELARFFTQGNPAHSLSFSPDGGRLLVADDAGTAQIWDLSALPKGDLLSIACARLGTATSLEAVEARYGLTRLQPICGENAPRPIAAGLSG